MGGDASFPAIFYDGVRETSIGDVAVWSGLSFKSFQAIVSRRIGISPHQVSIYLVNRSNPRFSARKVPITSKVDFGNILKERDCAFLVVLKRSRRERRRRGQRESIAGKWSPPANVVLLRRRGDVDGGDGSFSVMVPIGGCEAPARRRGLGLDRMVNVVDRRVEMQGESDVVNMGLGDLRIGLVNGGVDRRVELERESDMMNMGLGLGDLRLDRVNAPVDRRDVAVNISAAAVNRRVDAVNAVNRVNASFDRRVELERESDVVRLGLRDLRLDRVNASVDRRVDAAVKSCVDAVNCCFAAVDRRNFAVNRRDVAVSGGYGGGSVVVCEECSRGVEFHLCVYDTVTVGFRSPAGPVARPE